MKLYEKVAQEIGVFVLFIVLPILAVYGVGAFIDSLLAT